MAGTAENKTSVMTILEAAFPEDSPPPALSVAVVSLVELCQRAMPDPDALRQALDGAGFAVLDQDRADGFGSWLALDNKVFAFPVRNLRHRLYAKERRDEVVMLLVSEGESAEGPVIFCSTIFWGAIEADAVKAAAHVTKRQPLTGTRAINAEGAKLRRVFWDTGGVAGVRGFMVTGPENVEVANFARAFTAFNIAGRKTG